MVPAIVYRGGTSRGIFFHEEVLPNNIEKRNHIFYNAIDSSNPSQVNGLGGGTSHTSKIVVISKPSVKNVHVDYTFFQMGIGKRIVDDKGTCGNLMAAVGAFAVDEGFVPIHEGESSVKVYAYNTNIRKILEIDVPLENGRAKVHGDYLMAGVKTTGAKFTVDILNPGGGKTGKTLPLGLTFNMGCEASFIDVVNPFVYIPFQELGLTGLETNEKLMQDNILLEKLEEYRCRAAVAVQMESSLQAAQNAPAVPKIALVRSPFDYVTSVGQHIYAEDYDIFSRMLSMGKVHRTFAGSGLYNLAAAVELPGTIPNQLSSKNRKKNIVRIGHPEGIIEVRVQLTEQNDDVHSVGLERTARLIMKGDLYIPYEDYESGDENVR